MAGMAFASIGFISAFLVGIPAAKLGMKKHIVKHGDKLDEVTLRGYLRKEEQTEYMVKDTTVNSNLETLGFHFAVIGVCYVLAHFIGHLLDLIPGIGESLGSMMFMNGMYAAYIVKLIFSADDGNCLEISFALAYCLEHSSSFSAVCRRICGIFNVTARIDLSAF